MGIYIGVDGKARRVKGAYLGVDGKARRIAKAYIGDENGKAKLVWAGRLLAFTFSCWLEDQNGKVSLERWNTWIKENATKQANGIFHIGEYYFVFNLERGQGKHSVDESFSMESGVPYEAMADAVLGYYAGDRTTHLKLKEIIYTDNGVEKTAADSKFEMALTDDPEKNYIKVIYWAPWAET